MARWGPVRLNKHRAAATTEPLAGTCGRDAELFWGIQ
jgi:hypothetical protein